MSYQHSWLMIDSTVIYTMPRQCHLVRYFNNTDITLEQSIYRPDLLTNSFIKLSIIKIGITVGSCYVKSSS